MNNDSPKWWLDSGTVQKALLTLLPALAIVLQFFGVDFSDSRQNAVMVIVLLAISTYASIKLIVDRFNAGNKKIAPLTLSKGASVKKK